MAEAYTGPERRYYKRLNVNLPLKFYFVTAEGDSVASDVYEAISLDISGGGLSLEVAQLDHELIPKLFSGLIRLLVIFALPGTKETIKAMAKAVWITKRSQAQQESDMQYCMGLQFLDITERDRDKIIDYIVNSLLQNNA